MDIWNWVDKLTDDLIEAGQENASSNIYALTNLVCDLEYERAASLVQEIKALGKSIGNPWLEVYAGHWEMRNRLGYNFEGESALADVIRLFEFAHRDNTKECPQSVCVTQDVSTCYGNIDGPGWAEERIAVCDETLARINPKWTCFYCISAEKALALEGSSRPEEAFAFLDNQIKILLEAGIKYDNDFFLTQAGMLIRTGRYEEALLVIEKFEDEEDENKDNSKQTTQACMLHKIEALAKLGRDEEAWKLLPPLAETAYDDRPIWIRAVSVLLQRAPERNDWCLGRELQQTLDHFSRVGSHRPLIDAALLCARLALQRQSAWNARCILELAKRHQPKLRADHGALAALNLLQAEIEAESVQPLPVPSEQLIHWITERGEKNQSRNPEEEIEWLLAAHNERPDDIDILECFIEALQACAAFEDAIEWMWRYVKRHSQEETRIGFRLLDSLLWMGKADEVERLASLYRESQPVFALWCKARQGFKDGDWPTAVENCRRLLEQSPNSQGARGLMAQALRRQGNHHEAVDCYQIMVEHLENPNDGLWDLMTSASAIQDWDTVRTAAKKLQIELSTDQGPIEEDWGTIIIRYQENSSEVDYYAQRTGPATARIFENAIPGKPQHIRDWVVFDGTILEKPPEDEEEQKNFIRTYAFECLLESGGYGPSWLADGVHPGEEAYQAFCEAIKKLGCCSWVHSNPEYTVTDSEDGQEWPGFYFSIAAPTSISTRELDKWLNEYTSQWKHRLSWARLAQAAGVDIEPHTKTIERYGL